METIDERRGTGDRCAASSPTDLEAVIALDAKNTGRRRDGVLQGQAAAEPGRDRDQGLARRRARRHASPASSWPGCTTASSARSEPVAVLDTLDVHPDFRRQRRRDRADRASCARISTALGVHAAARPRCDWSDTELLAFFHHQGFRPADRLCLDLDLPSKREPRGGADAAARARAMRSTPRWRWRGPARPLR